MSYDNKAKTMYRNSTYSVMGTTKNLDLPIIRKNYRTMDV